MNELEQFRQTFFEECDELLQQFESAALLLVPGDSDLERLNELFRAAHSIKAGAGAFKLDRLVVYTHELENFLDKVRMGDLVLQEDDPDMIVQAGDILFQLVDAARSDQDAPAGIETPVLKDVRSRLNSDQAEPTSVEETEVAEAGGASDYRVYFRPFRSLYESANEPQLLLGALQSVGETELRADLSKLPDLSAMDPMEGYISWTAIVRGVEDKTELEEIFEFVDGDCELEIESLVSDAAPVAKTPQTVAKDPVAEHAGPSPESVTKAESAPNEPAQANARKSENARQISSIRVDLDRVDQLVDMVGELVIAQAMAIESISKDLDVQHVRQLQALEDLTLRTRQLQEGVMAIRMQPVKTMFSRFPRIVRDLSKKLGKNVRLDLDGETTEVDKTIIEELSDPLTHMIRNSMDHGIETPEKRAAAGKAEEAVLRLSAEQRNGRILIRVSDDGAGINVARVKQRAVERGLIAEGAELTKDEVHNLLFQPGFSTASEVSDVSGRGVGMDVVRKNIQKLGGRVMVDSEEGKGSTFTLALPLTLAVLDGMLISVAGQRYVIPLSSIIETVCPEQKNIREMPEGGSVLSLRGEVIRLVDLVSSMNLSRNGQVEPLRKLVVIVETELGRQIGIVVDELLGQQQVVIKSLEVNYHRIPGVAGTAILGDGRVRLILDIDGLSDMSPTSLRVRESSEALLEDQLAKGA